MHNVEVIIPIYNGEQYIEKLNTSLQMQKNVSLKITYLLTESSDASGDLLLSLKARFKKIKKEEYSHSVTREEAVLASDADYVVMLSQDVEIVDEEMISKMVHYTLENHLGGCYVRQKSITPIDKYFREISYPVGKHIYGKKELSELGREAIFFSDACSLMDRKVFEELGGYDHKRINTNEDMYYSYKMLTNDIKVGYLGDTYVLHSHKLSVKSSYRRYKEIGYFFAEQKEIGALPGKNGKYFKIIGKMLKHFDILGLICLPFHVFARILGMKKGKRLYRMLGK